MATYHAITTSEGGTVTDTEAVEQLFDEYLIHCDYAQVRDGQVDFGGDGPLDPIETFGQEGHLGQPVPNAFFTRLSQYLEDELIVKTIGFEAARYVNGYQYRVTPDGDIFLRTLTHDETKTEPEDHAIKP